MDLCRPIKDLEDTMSEEQNTSVLKKEEGLMNRSLGLELARVTENAAIASANGWDAETKIPRIRQR